MARPPDPTALAREEARAFRDRVREMKNAYRITSYQLSERLQKVDPKGRWTERKVTNALAEGRPLLAETARQILKALKPTAAQERAGQGRPWKRYAIALSEDNSWLHRLVRRTPAAFVPLREAERLAALLAFRLVRVPYISKRRRDKIASVIESELKKAAPHMAELWLHEMTGVVVRGIAEAVQGGMPAPPPAAMHLVPQVLQVAYEIEFAKKSGQRKKGKA